MIRWAAGAVLILCSVYPAAAQSNYYYGATDITGRLTRTAVTNVSQTGTTMRALSAQPMALVATPEVKRNSVEPQPRTLEPKALRPRTARELERTFANLDTRTEASALTFSMPVLPAVNVFGFAGLTHYDQRNANNGNQFSVEPPNPEIAVANGWVLAGVNNAIQVYSTGGAPLLPRVLSTNELFQVPAAINRTNGDNGVYPTDMRVFYDHGIDRWFVVQRAQDYDLWGYAVNSSHLYMAVSQTGNPTGAWNIYTMNTTNASHIGCPCFSDFPQIGADQYGIYISSDEYDTGYGNFVDATILAMSKLSLAAGDVNPRLLEFVIPRWTGYEASIRPAITPPGASYALARGGVEFFLSTQSVRYSDNGFGLWALTNTASLNTTPNLRLMQTVIPGIPYTYPDVATQKPGLLPYGSTLTPPGLLAFIDGGRDSRVLSLAYAAGRLFATFATAYTDDAGHGVVAGAWAMLYPSLRGEALTAPVSRFGYLVGGANHVLRPAAAVNASGRGAIAFTLVGPDHFPSAAFVPIEGFMPGATIQVAAAGTAPEDGFTGYPDLGFSTSGVARWGDYSCAVAAADGSIWMTAEYIPGGMRAEMANWGTRVFRFGP
jgi:hypothetical protein